MKYHITFPQKSALRNGYTVIIAENEATARNEAVYQFGHSGWSGIYVEGSFDFNYFPDGQYGRDTVLPDGYQH